MEFGIGRGDFGGKCRSSFKIDLDESRDNRYIMTS